MLATTWRVCLISAAAFLVQRVAGQDWACVANHATSSERVLAEINRICVEYGFQAQCVLPGGSSCGASTFSQGDYVFSRWFKAALGQDIAQCDFNGAAVFASSDTYLQWGSFPECIDEATVQGSGSVSLPGESYQRAPLVTTGKSRHGSVIKGISWGPVPIKYQGGSIPVDDWMDLSAKAMWGARGRGDLRIMRQMGANLIRLYGNNPDVNHKYFLDEAHKNGLAVVPGMSDFPFFQMPGSCATTGYDCFSQVKPLYLQNLIRGFAPEHYGAISKARAYHPAMHYMIVINEPDLKTPPDAVAGETQLRLMCKAVISAFDAMLDAERDAGLVGPGVNFTVTMSFASCISCPADWGGGEPGLPQLVYLEDAMLNPENYGYTPKNDLKAAYWNRWIHSINTQNTAEELNIGIDWFTKYAAYFPRTPVWIGEYHSPRAARDADLDYIMDVIPQHPLFFGISFFQYQIAYWKGGHEEDFGALTLGDYKIATMPYYGTTFDVFCVQEDIDDKDATIDEDTGRQVTIARAITKNFGGSGVDWSRECLPSPEAVELSEQGFEEIKSQGDVARMKTFIERVIEHLGYDIVNWGEFNNFAKRVLESSTSTLESTVTTITQNPGWTEENDESSCIADRDAYAAQILAGTGFVCDPELDKDFDCADIPEVCRGDIFAEADWVFSKYYQDWEVFPLVHCYFGGAAILAPPSRRPSNIKAECINADVDAAVRAPLSALLGGALSLLSALSLIH